MGPASERSVRTVPFSGEAADFPAWKIKFRAMMDTKGLRDIIDGLSTEDKATDRDAWRQANRQAYSQIVMAVDEDSVMRTMECEDDGRGAWVMLCEHFQSTDKARLANLRQELLLLRCKGLDDLDAYLLRMKDIFGQLNLAVQTKAQRYDDRDKIELMLRGLGFEFDALVTSLELWLESTEDAKFETVESKVRAFARSRLFQEDRVPGQASAMYAARGRRSVKSEGAKERHRAKECYNCGGLVHIKRNCYKQGGGKEGQGPSPENKNRREPGCAMAAQEFAFAAYKRSEIGGQDAWVVDSGCTSHMCKNRKMFTKIKPVCQRIWLADGRVARVDGIGEVRVSVMDVNGARRTATLKDVLLIPSLGHNLFSVPKATRMGHSILFGQRRAVIRTREGVELPLREKGQLYVLLHHVVHEECDDEDDDDDWDEMPLKVAAPVKTETRDEEFEDAMSEEETVMVKTALKAEMKNVKKPKAGVMPRDQKKPGVMPRDHEKKPGVMPRDHEKKPGVMPGDRIEEPRVPKADIKVKSDRQDINNSSKISNSHDKSWISPRSTRRRRLGEG